MHLSKLSKTLVLTGLLALAGAASAQKTQLLVYTALETDQIKAYQEGFNKVNPDIEIKWVRDSTGVITAKLLAEKANPQADVVMENLIGDAWKYSARNPRIASAFDEKRMKRSPLIDRIAGTESTAKITSVISIITSTTNSGVANNFAPCRVNSFWPS